MWVPDDHLSAPDSHLMTWKHRYSVLSILFGAYLLCYFDRMIMATSVPFIAADFGLSSVAVGGVLSAFFAGYALMQVPGGLLADRFGPRAVLAVTIVWWSIMTGLTGLVSSLTGLLFVRFLFGLGEGPFPSAASKALSIWFPPRELGRANGLQLASTALGAAVAPLFVTTVMKCWGWRAIFYALFVPGFLLALAVFRYVRNSPAESSRLTCAELAEYGDTATPQISLKEALSEAMRTPAVLWCAAAFLFANMMNWGLLSWLPTYLLRARAFDVQKMGLFTAVTGLCFSLGLPAGGYLCDRYLRHHLRAQILAGLLGSAAMTGLAASAPTGEWAVACFALAFFCVGICNVAVFTLPLLVVPKHAVGGAFGIVNTAGQVSGVLSPLLIGYVLDVTHDDFRTVLYCLVGLCIVAVYPASRIRQGAMRLGPAVT
jgi:MFS family permease